jgi:hypothetical protein
MGLCRSLVLLSVLISVSIAIDVRSIDIQRIKAHLKPLEVLHERTKIASQKHNFQYSEISVECK